jgi:iron(III) transport system substrate-binding protein
LCRGIVANFARPPRGGDTDQLRAVASGESDIAVANTYYFANLMRSAKPEDRALIAKLGVVFPNQRDRGTHVNISGGGIAVHAKNPEGARAFLEYLVSPQAQAYFADGNSEYPVIAGAATGTQLAALGAFREDQLNARIFAENNPRALQIMERAGWR